MIHHELAAFAELAGKLGVELPGQVREAYARAYALHGALDRAFEVPLPDLAALDPDNADGFVTGYLDASLRRGQQFSTDAEGLRGAADGHVVEAIVHSSPDILAALRPVHDEVAEQVMIGALLTKGHDDRSVLHGADEVRQAWITRADRTGRLKDVRRLRGQLAQYGVRPARWFDQARMQIAELTEYIDVPATFELGDLTRWYQYAQQHVWERAVAEGARLWLPTPDEHREAVERVHAQRQILLGRVKAA